MSFIDNNCQQLLLELKIFQDNLNEYPRKQLLRRDENNLPCSGNDFLICRVYVVSLYYFLDGQACSYLQFVRRTSSVTAVYSSCCQVEFNLECFDLTVIEIVSSIYFLQYNTRTISSWSASKGETIRVTFPIALGWA